MERKLGCFRNASLNRERESLQQRHTFIVLCPHPRSQQIPLNALLWAGFNRTAAALPCEMPKDSDNRPLLRTGPSASAEKYARRMQATMRRRLGMDAAPAQE